MALLQREASRARPERAENRRVEGAGTYWVGEAMGGPTTRTSTSPTTRRSETTRMLAANAAHLAALLKREAYPGE